jgi:multiple sugar transport system permease protein
LPALIIMSLWSVGGGMIIYLAGLQGIPTTLFEAATMDGANSWHRLWHITLPLISPVIFYNLVIGIIGTFQYFTSAYVMTNGGPAEATMFYNLYLYNNAFRYQKMGYASALAWVLLLIVLVLTMLVFRSSAAWVYYEGELKRR